MGGTILRRGSSGEAGKRKGDYMHEKSHFFGLPKLASFETMYPLWIPRSLLRGASFGFRPQANLGELSGSDPSLKRSLYLFGCDLQVSFRSSVGLVQGKPLDRQAEEQLGDPLRAGLRKGDVPEKQGLGLP